MEEPVMTLPITDTTTHDTGLTIRKAAGADRSALVDTLTAAFHDDPVMSWWIPDPQRRPQILRSFFEVVVDVNQPHDELYVTEPDPVSAAVWVPPGCQSSGEAAEQMVGWLVDAAAETADRLLAVLELMDQHHPQDSHAYLFFVGTLPQWQSRGIGSALIREVLDRCDQDGIPAYLEASSIESQRLYLRHGFDVTGEIVLPDGPSMWPMWREPQHH
jgi:ribosomal protein S18 acetylase RimI-like enzyme